MSYNITGNDLDLADDRRYADYFTKAALSDGRVWSLMLEEERVDRTLEVVHGVKASIEQQLGQAKLFQNGGDQDWRKRTTNLLRSIEPYLADVKAEVKRLDALEREESAEGERDRWKEIAATLADLLDGNPALKMLRLPDRSMTVAGWRDLRAAKLEVAA